MLTVLSVLSLGIHAAAALPVHEGHESGTSHQATASNCLTICTTATPYKEEAITDDDKDEDDIPQPPFYTQFQTLTLLTLQKMYDHVTKVAIDREPPPSDVPAYISLTVFRV